MNPAQSVSINLPSGWFELDPRAPDLMSELGRAIGVPPDAPDGAVALLAPIAAALRHDVEDADVVLVGGFAQAIEFDEGDEPLIITANVVLAVSPPVEQAVQDGVRSAAEPVDLPAGPSVLITGEVGISDPRWERPVPARTRRYLVPVPGTDRLAVLAFQTPNLDLADQFDDVFAAIAESLAFDLPDGSPS